MQPFKAGDVFKSKSYGLFEVVSRSPGKAVIRFLDTGFSVEVSKSQVYKGTIKDKLSPQIYGLGYYGDESFTSTLSKRDSEKALEAWHTMFKRCYSEKVHVVSKSYIGCEVSTEWFNFQSFAQFYTEYKQEGWELDKDLLVRGNKVYGPHTCVWLPRNINGYIKTNSNRRGSCFIGVKLSYLGDHYEARCRDMDGKQKMLGKFSTEAEAFDTYKIFKESVIKQKANLWKNDLDPRAYDALMNYNVYRED